MSCGATAITFNHGHTLSIPPEDLDSATFKTYSIMGVADHNHTITLLPVQLAQLKAGATVTVTSTPDSSSIYQSHTHQVMVQCV